MPPAVYRDMQYDNDGVCHNKRNGGKLHGNISRNGYGNAIISRYVMTHKYRGSIVAFSISNSVEPNKEQKEMISSFQQGILYKH